MTYRSVFVTSKIYYYFFVHICAFLIFNVNSNHTGVMIMHNFCVCCNVNHLVAVFLFATFALFCFQLSVVFLYANENKQRLKILFCKNVNSKNNCLFKDISLQHYYLVNASFV